MSESHNEWETETYTEVRRGFLFKQEHWKGQSMNPENLDRGLYFFRIH
jgi:hypothetical protein